MVCKVRNKSWAGGIVVARKVEQEKSGGICKQWCQSFFGVFVVVIFVCFGCTMQLVGFLVPRLGMEPRALAERAWSPNHLTTRVEERSPEETSLKREGAREDRLPLTNRWYACPLARTRTRAHTHTHTHTQSSGRLMRACCQAKGR